MAHADIAAMRICESIVDLQRGLSLLKSEKSKEWPNNEYSDICIILSWKTKWGAKTNQQWVILSEILPFHNISLRI